MSQSGTKKRIVAAVILVLVAGGGAGAYRHFYGRDKGRGQAEKYRTQLVTRGDLTTTVATTGTVQPSNRLVIKPPINGRLDSVNVTEGQTVKKGQILAMLSSTERAAMIDLARSKGAKELAYWESLYRATPIVAPLDGLVIARSAEPGQSVTAQDSVIVISDRLVVSAQVDETDLSKVAAGQIAEITLDAFPEEKVQGSVTRIAMEGRIVSNVTVYDVEVEPRGTTEHLRSGLTASVTFDVSRKTGVLLVPTIVVRKERGVSTVLVAKKSDDDENDGGDAQAKDAGGRRAGRGPVEAESVIIQAGASDGQRTEVISGLQEGDEVLEERRDQGQKGGAAPAGTNPFMPAGGQRRVR